MKKVEYNIRTCDVTGRLRLKKVTGYYLGEKHGYHFGLDRARRFSRFWSITEMYTGLHIDKEFRTIKEAKEWFDDEFEKEITKEKLDEAVKSKKIKKPANEKIKLEE